MATKDRDNGGEELSFLVVVLDTNPYYWAKKSLEVTHHNISNGGSNNHASSSSSTTSGSELMDWNSGSSSSSSSTQQSSEIDFSTLLEHLFVFINAYFMLNPQNMLAIFAAHTNTSTMLYPDYDEDSSEVKESEDELIMLTSRNTPVEVSFGFSFKKILMSIHSSDPHDQLTINHPTISPCRR